MNETVFPRRSRLSADAAPLDTFFSRLVPGDRVLVRTPGEPDRIGRVDRVLSVVFSLVFDDRRERPAPWFDGPHWYRRDDGTLAASCLMFVRDPVAFDTPPPRVVEVPLPQSEENEEERP